MSVTEDQKQSGGPLQARISRRDMIVKSSLAAGLLAGGGSLAAFLDACGGTSSTPTQTSALSASALAELAAEIDAARAIPKFQARGPAFDAKPAHGKTVFYLSVIQSVPIVDLLWRTTQQAAQAAGLNPVLFDGKGQQQLYVAGMEQAIARKVDCILIESIAVETLTEPIKRARAAGIKVIELNELQPTVPVDGKVTFDYIGAAQLEADWVLLDSKGVNINVVVMRAPHPTHIAMAAKIKERFDKYVPGKYKLAEQIIEFADWETRTPVITRTLMTGDPTINYMIPVVDGQSLFVVPALKQAGYADKVKISTFNATGAILDLIKNQDVVWADNGQDTTFAAWSYIDQALRTLTNQTPVDEYHTPNRMLDRANISTVNTGDPSTFFDDAATKAAYKQLWGVA